MSTINSSNGSSSSSNSKKQQVFENSTPVKAGRGHKSKFQKLNNSDEMTDGAEMVEKNAQVPVIGESMMANQPTVPSSSADQSIDDESLIDDSPMTNYPFYQEISVNTNNMYTDYQNGAVPIQIGSPYYVYPSAYTQPEYQLLGTPQQNCSLYQTYVYDPSICAYTLNTYSSPIQQHQQHQGQAHQQQQQQHQQQQQQTQKLSSPQQTSLLGSYQTPRQAQNLYSMVNSCMSPMDSTVPTSNESSSNSPCQYQYVMYPTQNAYLSPMSAPQAYMMYQTAPQALQQTPTSIPSDRIKPRRNNNKRSKHVETTTPSTNSNDHGQNVYHMSNNVSPISNQDQHLYQNHQQQHNNHQNQQMDDQSSHGMYMNGQSVETMYPSPVSMCSPAGSDNPYAFCDPNNSMFNLQSYYDYVNGGIQSFGDENDDEQEEDLDQENEQLACYTCRGRRMCFCYFLKVRYYKFPSFLDLVDHQYKKWRQNMMKAKKSN